MHLNMVVAVALVATGCVALKTEEGAGKMGAGSHGLSCAGLRETPEKEKNKKLKEDKRTEGEGIPRM